MRDDRGRRLDPGSVRDTDLPAFLPTESDLVWQMARPEKYALLGLLQVLEPEVAIEIGTFRGGSLQVLSAACGHVHSIDVDPECARTLGGRFDNVTFHTGESAELLSRILGEIQDGATSLSFVLVDGDHSEEGVREDLRQLLAVTPEVPLVVVCHDSFNPECREGIRTAPWAANPWVHYVELDYVTGVLFREARGTVEPGSMWGGLALALLLPARREGELVVSESSRALYDAAVGSLGWLGRDAWPRRTGRRVKRLAGSWLRRVRG